MKLILILLLVLPFSIFGTDVLPYSDFLKEVESGNVKDVLVVETLISGTLNRDGKEVEFYTGYPQRALDDPQFVKTLESVNPTYEGSKIINVPKRGNRLGLLLQNAKPALQHHDFHSDSDDLRQDKENPLMSSDPTITPMIQAPDCEPVAAGNSGPFGPSSPAL